MASYVIYHKETTVKFSIPARSANMWKDTWGSKGAAMRALNKAVLDEKIVDITKYGVAEATDFHNNIEKTVTRRNLISGEEFEERVNTPGYLSPASESYHTM